MSRTIFTSRRYRFPDPAEQAQGNFGFCLARDGDATKVNVCVYAKSFVDRIDEVNLVMTRSDAIGLRDLLNMILSDWPL